MMAKPLALTSGEPAGIGPDITIMAWLRRHELKLPTFYVRGDRGLLDQRARILGLKAELSEVRVEDAQMAFADTLPVVATGPAPATEPRAPGVQRPVSAPRSTLAVAVRPGPRAPSAVVAAAVPVQRALVALHRVLRPVLVRRSSVAPERSVQMGRTLQPPPSMVVAVVAPEPIATPTESGAQVPQVALRSSTS